MITCKQCKWWGERNLYTVERECTNLILHNQDPNRLNGAGVDDGYGIIETGPDFGCIHGELASGPDKP